MENNCEKNQGSSGRKIKSVARRIVILLVAGVAAYSIILFSIVRLTLRKGLINDYEEELKELSVISQEEFDYVMEQVTMAISWCKGNFEDDVEEKGLSWNRLDSLCSDVLDFFYASEITFFDKQGNQVSDREYGNIPRYSIVDDALKGVSRNNLIKEGADIYAVSAMPLRYDTEIVGAVAVKKIASDEELVTTITTYTNGSFAILDENRYYASNILALTGTEVKDTSVVTNAKRGESSVRKENLAGEDFIAYYFPLKDSAGNSITTLLLGKPLSLVESVISNIYVPLLVAAVICSALLIFGLLTLTMESVVKPLKRVSAAVKNLSSGEADLTVRLPVKGNDEFAELSLNVNKFIKLLQGIVKELKDAQTSLKVVSEELGTNSQESASATAQIMANISGVRKQSENQSGAVKNTSEVLGKSSVSVKELGSLIDNQAAGITESSASIEEMLGNISAVTASVRKMDSSFEELNKTVEDGNVKLTSVDQKVKQIAENSNMLIQANTIISKIASETNLLAMNAAIEAAHAGDAGEGFSVVANEIRKLAENSSRQSKQINNELKAITSSIQDVVTLSHESQTAFGAIVNNLGSTTSIIHEIDNAMTEQEAASRQIFEALSEIKNQTVDVRDKSQEMNSVVEKVTENMETVNQISSTILGSMDEMASGAQQISESAQSASNLATQTKSNIEVMSEKLGRFKV